MTQTKASSEILIVTDEVFPAEPDYSKIAQGKELKLYMDM